jgi:hypothetical protein
LGQHIRDIGTMGRDRVAAGIAAATHMATRRGFVAAGDLRVGDAVLTRDNGYQPLLCITPLGLLTCIAPGDSGLRLRPDHGVLDRAGPQGEEMLVPARRLECLGAPSLVRTAAVALHFDRHEILLAEDRWIESQPGAGAAARPRLTDPPLPTAMRKFRVATAGRDA